MRLGLQLTLPRDSRFVPVMRHLADSLLRETHAPSDAIYDVELALSEACANVVRHADGCTEYSVSLSVDRGGCEIDVVDLGPGFDPSRAITPRRLFPGEARSVTDEPEGGRGLMLIQALVDELQFVTEDDENRVRLVKYWPAVTVDGAAAPSGR